MTKKIKVLTLSDHPLSPSGVGTQTRYVIEALLKTGKFEVLSLGGAIKHHDYTAKVEAGTAPLKSERIPLRWPGYTSYSMSDYRVALAVAGGGLFLEYKKTSSGYIVDCKITIDVKYSNDYSLTVFDFDFMRLYIDEAIFTALQDIGWYHPFYAHYKWQLEV